MNPVQGAALFHDRIRKLQAEMASSGVDLVAVAPTANMRYLLGFAPLADERPCVLLVSVTGTALVVPELNADQVEAHTGMTALRWTDAEGPEAAFHRAFEQVAAVSQPVLAADDSMRADHLILLQDLLQPRAAIPVRRVMAPLRMRKGPEEIERLVRGAELADRALMAGVGACRPGVTEREVAEEITRYFLQHGAESVDFTIVASGPNGAFPHHETGDRRLEPGDVVIIDIGATLEGYKSDVTRVVYLGNEPPEDVQAVYQAVLEANTRGREAARPGVKARDVDRAARQALESAGYGAYFLHRTGHGLGLETHEPPWITGESETVLEPGMVFSVEPGVYLQGRFGVRIEDIVVVTEDGHLCLTGLDRALICKST